MKTPYEQWNDELNGERPNRSGWWLVTVVIVLLIGLGIASQVQAERTHPAAEYVE